MKTSLESKAYLVACEAHKDAKRKYSGAPYIVHPAAVVEIVRGVPHTEEMLAAAWLHDVVEDTAVSLGQIKDLFGVAVMTYVCELTNVSQASDGNRETRKALDRAHLAHACAEAQTIKLADLLDNTADIAENDPAFAKIYVKEKRALLEVLQKGDPTLLKRAQAQVELLTRLNKLKL